MHAFPSSFSKKRQPSFPYLQPPLQRCEQAVVVAERGEVPAVGRDLQAAQELPCVPFVLGVRASVCVCVVVCVGS
jgi:hypothetical protein